VLFTDWREVKHCVEAMQVQGPESRPMFTSVFCVESKQQCRAARWALTFAERTDPIYVNGSLLFAESTVISLLQTASQVLSNDAKVPPMSPLSQLMKDDAQMSCSFEVVHPTANEKVLPRFDEVQPVKDEAQATERLYHNLSSKMDVPVVSLFELTHPKNGVQAYTVSQWTQLTKEDVPVSNVSQQTQLKENQVQALPLRVTKPANSPVVGVLPANPEVTDLQSNVTAYVAWIWESLVSPAEVEKALLAAMPESYED